MKKEVYIKVKSDGKTYRGDTGNLDLIERSEVLFENEQGQDVGLIILDLGKEEEAVSEEVTIIRKLTDKDIQKCKELKEEARGSIGLCKEKIKKHGLDMELLDADISYDGKKITFYFSATGRVDFRSLVPDLAATFKKLIRLQQVGSRDKAKCLNGVVGRCGREACCKHLRQDYSDEITLEMANVQNIGQSGAGRVTGACGKLMCCLKYELAEYERKKKAMPAIGSEYRSNEGIGLVVSQNIMKNKLVIELKKEKRLLEVDCC